MERRLILPVVVAAVVLLVLPAPAAGYPIEIVEDRVYRVGVFLVVDSLVANRSERRIDGVEATVEFRDFFGGVLRVEYTVARPLTLGPGHVGALRVATPHSEDVRSLHYRFTWQQDGEQFQSVVRRDIWRIGAPSSDPAIGRAH
jgi:hypothetical protein